MAKQEDDKSQEYNALGLEQNLQPFKYQKY